MPASVASGDRAPAEPVATTPLRRPGSLRRTSHLDAVLLPVDGGDDVPVGRAERRALHGLLTLRVDGEARDLLTTSDGDAEVVATATLSADADTERDLTRLETAPAVPGTDGLLGSPARQGLRGRLASLDVPADSPLALLLFDLPGATLVSGYGISRAMVLGGTPEEQITPAEVADYLRGVCAGWRPDGVPFQRVREGRGAPPHPAPLAPEPDDPQDPAGWHLDGRPAPRHTRRRRRLDVVRDGDEVVVDTHFRDSHVDPDGTETVVHEYTLGAWFDADLRLAEIGASPRVLPYAECPLAVRHLDDLVGTPLADLDAAVRTHLAGVRGCTHLSDTVSSLAGLAGLVTRLPD